MAGSVSHIRPLSRLWPLRPGPRALPVQAADETSANAIPARAWPPRRPLSSRNPLLGGSRPVPAAAPETWTIAGHIYQLCQPAARTVRLYRRADGELVAETTSAAADGAYVFTVPDGETLYYVVALDDDAGLDYNAVIADRIRGRAGA